MQAPEMIAKDLAKAREQNPWVALNPAYEACLSDIIEFTCKRYPEFCTPTPGNETLISGSSVGKKNCGGCGK